MDIENIAVQKIALSIKEEYGLDACIVVCSGSGIVHTGFTHISEIEACHIMSYGTYGILKEIEKQTTDNGRSDATF